ncbi:O-antigen ligase family protein [Sphingomonas sp. LY160]|uniref:O-antigen ligase family protein n=1 Tax=Sphingomonas sp. LY160 TaxID=3095342 RepID=UPI002ADEF80B|nr:O-antigen ligase family protein [Sphingomonas sp. LY160]MEA1071018.1 O-antigen ligase family protein [Sphingomonas sp. LY160]
MIAKLQGWVAPIYLALCLLLGGSVQGIWAAMVLQVLGVFILVWAAFGSQRGRPHRGEKALRWIVVAAIGLVFLQLVPLPASLWESLPGRSLLADGFRTLGFSAEAMPISLSPYDTLMTLPTFIPPIAMLVSVLRLSEPNAVRLAATLVGTTLLAVMLGVLQSSTTDPNSSVYLYPISNFGTAVGFFANSNHMATLLLVAIPMIMALGATVLESSKDSRKKTAAIALTAAGVGVVLVGLALNRSLAGYGLAVPVALASAATILAVESRMLRRAAAGLAVAALLGVAVLIASPLGNKLMAGDDSVSISSRGEILETTKAAIDEFGLIGTGLGTYSKVYPLFEQPSKVDRTFINHAHNDYAEILLELGFAGVLLTFIFMLWWLARVRDVVTTPSADHFAMASTIATATILIHSAVDYPLRTAAIASVFAMCLGLMMASRRIARGEDDLRPTRHLVID